MRAISVVDTMRIEFDLHAVVDDSPPADPHAIVSITDDGGPALVTTAAPHGLSGGEYILLAGTTGYDQLATVGSVASSTTFDLADLTGNAISFAAPSTGGTWAAVTQHVDTYTTNQTLGTAAWVVVADFASTAKGANGTATDGGGGGSYVGGRLTAPFPATLSLVFTSGTPNLTGTGKQLQPAAAVGATGGAAASCVSTGFANVVAHTGGNGGATVGGGGGVATKDGDGQSGNDGDGGTTTAFGGIDGSGNTQGGTYTSAIDGGPSGQDGRGPGCGGSAGGAATPGSGIAGQLVVTSYTLA